MDPVPASKIVPVKPLLLAALILKIMIAIVIPTALVMIFVIVLQMGLVIVLALKTNLTKILYHLVALVLKLRAVAAKKTANANTIIYVK
jgi:hypothetical protein